MIKEEPIDLRIIDDKEIKKIQEKQKKIQRVMDLIRENDLNKDAVFMEEIGELIEQLRKGE